MADRIFACHILVNSHSSNVNLIFYMAVLYQKYRPAFFADVVGQAHIVQTLKNAIEHGKVGHAYLFCGSRGVGKTTFARIFAKAVNCESPNRGDACGKCKSCLDYASKANYDVVEIDAASYTGVDNIREIIEQSRSVPSGGKKRVYIIDEVHMLSRPAFSALLKTLEEPSQHVLFILATTESTKLPATVLSRVQKFDFLLHTSSDVQAHLEKILKQEKVKLESSVVQLITVSAKGGMRDALTLLDQVLALGSGVNEQIVRQMLGLGDRAGTERLLQLAVTGKSQEFAERFLEMEQSAIDFRVLCETVLEILRAHLNQRVLNVPVNSEDLLAGLNITDTVFVMRLMLRAYKDQVGSPEPSLPLFMAFAEVVAKFQHLPVGASTSPSSGISAPKSQMEPVVQPVHTEEPVEVMKSVGSETTRADVSVTASNVDVSQVQLLWQEVCQQVASQNVSLSMLLRQAHVESFQGEVLSLRVQYDFHKKKIQSAEYSRIILEKLAGLGVFVSQLSLQVDADFVPEVGGSSVESAMQILGGELAE